MRLKRLELLGFKSFATKVKLDFTEGITAIVGPNGSGKSNISDAVRWVLGEQSARTLRGSKMEDVIFAGSDGKKPLGMAEVHLTLDNSDQFLPIEYNEVTISRRVYRNGESQFLINKSPCRLKDIHDLFTDTGLGREGYAIISQGQIDAVLSARSQDRRALLEETAGIIKYRNRKEEALQKLERVDHDAERIGDILHEIEQRVGPLQKESAKTRTYNQLAANLLEVELDHYSLRLRQLDEKRQQHADSLRTHRQEHHGLAQQLAMVERRSTDHQENLSELEAVIDQRQEELMAASHELQKQAGERELDLERIAHSQQQLEHLQQEMDASCAEHTEWQQTESASADLVNQRTTVCQQSSATLRQLEAAYRSVRGQRDALERWLEEAKEAFFDTMRSLTDQRNKVREFDQRQQSLDAQRAQIKTEQDTHTQEQAELKQRVQVLQDQLNSLSTSRQQLETTGKIAVSQASDAAQRRAAAEAQRKTTEEVLAKLRSRRQALQDLEDNYEGLQYSVRQLLKAQPKGLRIIGTVSDVIQVPPGWETAIEIALGAAVGHVLVPARSHAQSAIQWLKTNKAGRATFLPVDSMKGQTFPQHYAQYWSLPGVQGPAMDTITVNESCRQAVASLLGRVVLTETLEHALALQKSLPSFGRIITKEGDVIAPSGAMTGGSLKGRSSGVLNRKNEISQIEQDELEQERQLAEETTLLEKRRQQEDELKQRVADLREEARSQGSDQEKTQLQLDQCTERLLKVAAIAADASEKEEVLADGARSAMAARAEAAKVVEAMQGAEQEQRQSIRNHEDKLKRLNEELDSCQEAMTAAKVEHTRALGSQQQAEDQLRLAQETTKKLAATLNAYQERSRELIKRSEELEQHRQTVEAAITRCRKQREVLEQGVSELRSQRNQMQAAVKVERQKEKQLQRHVNQQDRAIHALEIEERSVEMELQQITDEVAHRECEIHELFDRTVERSPKVLTGELDRLRREVKALGMVNPAAIEEYEELMQRKTFLKAQFEDLQEARTALHDVIQEMDQTSEQRFAEAFRKVRREFQTIFGQLFQGGRADLVLTEPEQLLSTGVEVVAQPPGKKLTNLLLLSGGERSLTAIALLFAIRRVKPTPFCVLDEIDAALDDSNLARFSTLMQEFARDTQFLVITHRLGTMEAADALYGVTMEKSAASQLMSVKLA